jgi:protein TonB
MFEDLVLSGRARPRRGTRALPLSLAFHGVAVAAAFVLPQLVTDLPPVAAAPPPPIPSFRPVRMVEVSPPTPRRPPAARRERPLEVGPTAPAAGSGPAMPSDLSHLGEGTTDDDSPALCLANCRGEGTSGVMLPGAIGSSDGDIDVSTPRRAGRDVTPPAKLSGGPPVYPELAKRARIEGDVVIECTIDPSGRVVNAVVTRSIPLLDEAALQAVVGWRYRPTLVDGVPVPVLLTVTVRFRIR